MPMSFNAFVEEKLGKLPHFMIYAVLEWIMIILLFVDGIIAFLSNELAKIFELRIPCLLCTRIDHVFVHRNPNFYYNDSICDVHKKDISALAYCHVHKKLSDIRNMCQGCLLSFATEKDPDADNYKSIVGILHKDVDSFIEEERKLHMKPLRNKDTREISDEKSGIPRCSCCGEPLNSKSSSKYKRSLSINAPTSSPRAFYASRNEEGGIMDFSHIRYTELKLMSEIESELPEDEDATTADNQGREAPKAAAMPLLPPDTEEINEDATRTPTFTRGNKFFGIPLSDSAQPSPRWANRGLARKLPFDSVMDPNDAGARNEVDSDIVTRLKRQVQLDRRSLMALYMELDEERSASAVAANNAMAMITRLQAEKAAVQMEASQYQRMMEEQAEYDQEALQIMKDLLFKREEDVKALESELEAYREKYGVIKKVGSEICEVDADEDYQDMKSQALSSDECGSLNGGDQNENDRPYERSMEFGGGNVDESSLDFEGERSYLMGLLKNLEKKITTPPGDPPLELGVVTQEDESREFVGNGNKAILTREVSLIRERLRAIEADSGFLKHAAMTLQRGGEGTKLLTEIAQHLRNLRQPGKSPSEDSDE